MSNLPIPGNIVYFLLGLTIKIIIKINMFMNKSCIILELHINYYINIVDLSHIILVDVFLFNYQSAYHRRESVKTISFLINKLPTILF